MRRPALLPALLLAVVAACATGFLREPLRPAETFSHAAHEDVVQGLGFSCTVCHPFTIDVLEADPERAADVSRALMVPGKEACHFCHKDAGAPVATIRRCTLCHEDIRPLRPTDHGPRWSDDHGLRARLGADSCRDCHREADCVRCHLRRDVAQRDAHPPTWRSFHAVEARLEAGRCQRCHVASTCVRCLERGEGAW